MTRQELKIEAMKLAPTEREAFAEGLLLSIGETEREAVDAAWLAEAKRRDQLYAGGRMAAVPVEEVLSRFQRKGLRGTVSVTE